MTVRFGVSPIAWINDDMPELGGDTPLATVLGDTRDVGFTGIELGGVFPRDATTLGPLLESYGLDLIGGWYSASLLTRSAEDEIAALQDHMALLKAMGSTIWVQAETSNAIHGAREVALSQTPRLSPQDWPQFGARLTQVADYLTGEGFRFAYHHHLGTVVERPEDLDAFIANTGPSVGLTLDTGHAALGGLDPVTVIETHPGRIVHVHCKDVRRSVFAKLQSADGSFLNGVLDGMFTVPGDGGLDYAAVMKSLAAIRYSGWIVVEAEQDPALADPRTYAALGLATLKQHAAAVGLWTEQ